MGCPSVIRLGVIMNKQLADDWEKNSLAWQKEMDKWGIDNSISRALDAEVVKLFRHGKPKTFLGRWKLKEKIKRFKELVK